MITWGLMGFMKEDHRSNVSFSSYYLRVIGYGHDITMDANLQHLAEIIFVILFHCKVSFYSHFPYCPLWKEITMHSPHIKSR